MCFALGRREALMMLLGKNYKGTIVSLHTIIHLISIQRVATEIKFREFMMKTVSH